jgi:hypothetical protein
MFGSNAALASAFRLLMGEAQNTPCSLCKSFHASHNLISYNQGIVPKRRVNPRWKKVRIFCLDNKRQLSTLNLQLWTLN